MASRDWDKTVVIDLGPVDLDVALGRDATFDPTNVRRISAAWGR